MGAYRFFNRDCRELLPELSSKGVAIVTDPPYGIALDTARKTGRRGRLCEIRNDYPPIIGDDAPFDPAHLLRFETVVLFGANHYADKLPASSGWIVWDKLDGLPPNDQSDCELAWTNRPRAARLFSHRWYGMIKGSEQDQARVHPTQKPVALFKWIIAQMKLPADTLIVDPYAGAGACGVAAAELGFDFWGCEIDAHYYRIALERIARAYRQAVFTLPMMTATTAGA